MTDMMFNMKVAQLIKIQKEEGKIKKEKERLKNEIKAEMTSRNVREIGTSKYEAKWISFMTHKLDNQALKKAMPVLYEKFSVPSETERFTYKEVG